MNNTQAFVKKGNALPLRCLVPFRQGEQSVLAHTDRLMAYQKAERISYATVLCAH